MRVIKAILKVIAIVAILFGWLALEVRNYDRQKNAEQAAYSALDLASEALIKSAVLEVSVDEFKADFGRWMEGYSAEEKKKAWWRIW